MIAQVREVLVFRELLWNLVLRDLNVRYKGTLLGFLWSLATPLVLAGVFYLLFTRVIPTRIDSYPLFLLSGVFPWSFLSISLGDATLSVVTNAGLVRRAYFPREILPLSPILSGLLHLCGSMMLLLVAAAWQGVAGPAVVFLPVVMLLHAAILYGLGLILSCAHAFFRDVHWMTGAITTLWFYASPVFYSPDQVPARVRPWYDLNPMVGILIGYRRILTEGRLPAAADLAVPVAAAAGALAAGFALYRRCAPRFAEEV